MTIENHDLEVDFNMDNPDQWTAVCSCGRWSSGPLESKEAAEDAWENHCDRIFMEATGG